MLRTPILIAVKERQDATQGLLCEYQTIHPDPAPKTFCGDVMLAVCLKDYFFVLSVPTQSWLKGLLSIIQPQVQQRP